MGSIERMLVMEIRLEEKDGKYSTINYSEQKRSEFEFEFKTQYLSGGFFWRFRNQMPIDQTNIMLSAKDSTINLLRSTERNVSNANWNVRKSVRKAIPKSAAKNPAKSISQINSRIILVSCKRLIQQPLRHRVPSISSAQSQWGW